MLKLRHHLFPAIAWGAIAALLVGFIVAVAAVTGSGDCWRNCDSEVDTVYSVAPLGIWAAAAGLSWTTLCFYLWVLPFRRGSGWWARVNAALVALVVTAPLVAVVVGLLRASGNGAVSGRLTAS